MSEQQAAPTTGETGSLHPEQSAFLSPDMPGELAALPEIAVVEAPRIAPDHEAPKADEIKPDDMRADAPKAPTIEPRPAARRRLAIAAMVTLAIAAGALGGALATFGLTHFSDLRAATSANATLEAAIARIDADVAALKPGLEHISRMGVSQFNITSDRLDRLEKAQAEPAARIAKLSEAVDRLRAAQQALPVPVAAAPAAPREITGSVTQLPAAASELPPTPAAATKTEIGRLPTVEGWVLTNVGYGGALIESRRGSYEVYAGDTVRGLGRIEAIRRQDGRWVVVTSKGLIVAR